MATSPTLVNKPARDTRFQLVHYCRMEVNYNDPGISSGIVFCTLPKGAMILGTDVNIQTTFNANSTNVLTVGSNSTQLDNVVAAGDVAEQTVGLDSDNLPLNTGAASGPLSDDTTFYIKYLQTGGTAATQGKAQVIMKFVPPNFSGTLT